MLSMFKVLNQCVRRDASLRSNKWQIVRSFTKKVRLISENVNEMRNKPDIKSLVKPFAFTVAFSGTVSTGYVVYNFEDNLLKQRFSRLNDWKQNLFSLNETHIQPKAGSLRNQINLWWNSRPDHFKLFAAIAAVNVMVFIGWKVPRLQYFMSRHFMTNTVESRLRCWPMLWSTFSHYSFTHLAFNMFVLYSFTGIGSHIFGCDQLLALYLSAGVISSFGSYASKIFFGRTGASLGASGAILTVLASCCVARPDIQLMIIFLPFFTIPAGYALGGIIAMDSAGLLLGWRLFDHAAHLSGTLFGIWYTKYGQYIVADNRSEVIKVWQKIRSKIV